MKLIAVGVMCFLAGSALTVIYYSLNQPIAVSAVSPADTAYDKNSQRLARIEALLLQANQHSPQTSSPADNQLLKINSKSTVDTAAQSLATQTGNAIVERALQSGTVTPADIMALTATNVKLSDEERQRLLAKLAIAINTDQVRFEHN